ncbi:hypothetical protein PG996_003167 [Apiospora saccharicola]|uniref:Uncharacterized protein n=1 Tax=Apiospora saccharicola TaxID=335842 RepID=A0ABR1W0I0_9PEZI
MDGAIVARSLLDPLWRSNVSGVPEGDFLARHIAGRLTARALRKIRQVVYLRTFGNGHHNYTTKHMRTQDWKLGTCFKGAEKFYTAEMGAIPSTAD